MALVLLLALSVPLQAVAALFGQRQLIAFGLGVTLCAGADRRDAASLRAGAAASVGGRQRLRPGPAGADLLVLLLSGTVLACCRPGRARWTARTASMPWWSSPAGHRLRLLLPA